ncbi:uncharacterized protein PV09_01444 [Verruconis gallopava]|uniref:Sm domain-containing protein n=1 Tax=Verruconis gallopava TaxID=253628 RepID=A0A0D1Z3G2_9PEZI|nr:uncharacterized protein PV09_01444 [Verruconis gallopava]KIW07477.1 hypothetical protein PV09_01444 [Verruconis gallopava]
MSSIEVEKATSLLSEYLGKTLRVHTDDKRIFVGQMKCTDRECNIILGLTQEYRPPAEDLVRDAAVRAGGTPLHMSYSHRFVGLVVVPGRHITKIELEEHITT